MTFNLKYAFVRPGENGAESAVVPVFAHNPDDQEDLAKLAANLRQDFGQGLFVPFATSDASARRIVEEAYAHEGLALAV